MANVHLKHPATASARTNSIRTNTESQSQDSYYNHLTHQSSSSSTSSSQLLPRPLISGLAPRHVYIHPDDQVEMLKQGLNEKDVPVQREWVLPTHAREKWSLKKFAAVFDSIETVPPDAAESVAGGEAQKHPWSRRREKRVLMAVVNDDSTIVYYIVHDAIVKPRQN